MNSNQFFQLLKKVEQNCYSTFSTFKKSGAKTKILF